MSKDILVLEGMKYLPDKGELWWRESGSGRDLTKPIGTLTKQGYLQCTVKRKQFKVHRLIWLAHYGVWPEGQIDHVNKDKADNRIENLREGNSVNQHNRDMPKPSSGVVGAHWNKRKQKYKSSIKVCGVNKHLGYFNCPTAAHLEYMKHKKEVLHV